MTEDELGALIAGVLLVGASWGVWRITRAAAAGGIRANAALGLRTPATTASEEAWEEGHRAALPVVRPLCVAAAVLAVAGTLAGSWPPLGAALVLAAAALLVGAAVIGGVVAHRAARLVQAAGRPDHESS